MINTYVAIDLETTGLNPASDKIIEIGAVKYENGVETETFETFVNPGILINKRITEITNIDDSMVKGAPDIAEVISKVVEFTEGYILLGHNILFDFSFLKKAAVDNGMEFEKKGIDTLRIAMKTLPEIESRSLEYLCKYFNISTVHHRALADAVSAAQIYTKMCEISDSENDAHQMIYRIPKQEAITPKQKAYLMALINKNKIEFSYKMEELTKSQASREIDRILSTYGMSR